SQHPYQVEFTGRIFVGHYNKVIDHFHHCREVTLFLKLSRIDVHECEKFVGIYKIEISGKCEVAGRNCMTLDKWMAEFHIVSSLGAIAEMAKEKFTKKVDMTFHQPRMGCDVGLVLLQLLYFLVDL